jgi:hypothetical protein
MDVAGQKRSRGEKTPDGRKQTRASLVPKKSRTKDDDEGRERLGEGEGIEMGDYVSKLAS